MNETGKPALPSKNHEMYSITELCQKSIHARTLIFPHDKVALKHADCQLKFIVNAGKDKEPHPNFVLSISMSLPCPGKL